ncbi:hypothetical protein K488DRAFT_92079 [Vararia minispora EC-137]|uniref:Uncharacterized protein n=1 Tax=Vararia minispora EC-137 TaxID=1314806 RepID=A0ACB8Q515_9AGAM|nr:hypothetical protein K488DRAFT_92079 [Vararia minispora EC-137]
MRGRGGEGEAGEREAGEKDEGRKGNDKEWERDPLVCGGSASSSIEGRIAALEWCKSASADEQLSFDGSRVVTPATLKGYIRSLSPRLKGMPQHHLAAQDKNSLLVRLSMLTDKMPSLHTYVHIRPTAAAISHCPHALCPARLPCDLFAAHTSFPFVYSATFLPSMLYNDDLMTGSKLGRRLQCFVFGDTDNGWVTDNPLPSPPPSPYVRLATLYSSFSPPSSVLPFLPLLHCHPIHPTLRPPPILIAPQVPLAHELHWLCSATDTLALLAPPTWQARMRRHLSHLFCGVSPSALKPAPRCSRSVRLLFLSGSHISSKRRLRARTHTQPLLVEGGDHKTPFLFSLSLVPHSDHPVPQTVTLLPSLPLRLPFSPRKYDSTLQMLGTIDTSKAGRPLPEIKRNLLASLVSILRAAI